MQVKCCSRCHQVKDVAEFSPCRREDRKPSFASWCHKCHNEIQRQRRGTQPKLLLLPGMRKCSVCHSIKGTGEFHRDNANISGYSCRCKDCSREKSLRHIAKMVTRKVVLVPEEKYCVHCGEIKPAGKFFRNRQVADGLSTYCKVCMYMYERGGRGKEVRRKYSNSPKGKIARQNSWHRYFSAKRGLLANFSDNDWIQCLKLWGESCAYCGRKTPDLQRDHFVPVGLGGTFTIDNIVPSCPSCNPSKSDNDPLVWCTTEQVDMVVAYFNEIVALHKLVEGVAK